MKSQNIGFWGSLKLLAVPQINFHEHVVTLQAFKENFNNI